MKAIEFTRASVALALCAALALVAASCEQRPVGPETEKPAGNWVKIHGWNDYYYNFSDVWAASTNEFFISTRSSNDQLIHYDDASWRAGQIELETGDAFEVEELWGRSPTDLYATGSVPSYRRDALIHFDGSAWSEAAIEAREGENLHDVWGDGTGHVFAVGFQVVHHFDGTSWSRTDIPGGYFWAVWGSSASDVYAVGINTYHYDGSAWSEMQGTSDMNLHGVWGSGPNDVYAVDWNGQHEIVRFDGTEWRTA
ncbi:hypothetical protein L0Y59_00105, partial [Candidatus Uhrbacteria bacterium]|nr:hypothetical protein [Candidatus Uhrbacteria bacterium]